MANDLNNMSTDELYELMAQQAFETAGLPEIEESLLEPGTYTNAQIAAKMRNHPLALVFILMQLPQAAGDASMRNILSLAIDKYLSKHKSDSGDDE